MKSLKTLAFDTTSGGISIAILDNHKIISSRQFLENSMQAEILIPLIEECLNDAKIWYQNLDLIAVTNGPGSFTSVRSGMSCAKALKLATKLPLITINALKAIAYDYKNSGYTKILVIMDAKLDELFIQEFEIRENILTETNEPQLISFKEIEEFLPKEKFLLAGNAQTLIKDALKNHQYFCISNQDKVKAENVGLMAMQIYKNNPDIKNEETLYIRKPRITERKS